MTKKNPTIDLASFVTTTEEPPPPLFCTRCTREIRVGSSFWGWGRASAVCEECHAAYKQEEPMP